MCILADSEIMHPFHPVYWIINYRDSISRGNMFDSKPIINWAHSNSLNAYNRHSDWHKLKVYATKMSIYF